MTESEFRRGRSPDLDQPGDDLRHRLELVDEAMLAINGNIANGRVPTDEAERDRCRLVGERITSKGRRAVDLLAKLPGVFAPDDERAAQYEREVSRYWTREAELAAQERGEPSPDAAFERERDAILREADAREQGEKP